MVREDEKYFSKENEVFNEWIRQINEALTNTEVEDVYVDATHLNDRSRDKTVNRLAKENIAEITNVVFTTPLGICLERNAKRTGRERVPDEVIRGMSSCCEHPERYNTIYVNERGETFE
jgi:predicted kinase